MDLTSRSKNPEIAQALGAQLKSGKVIVYSIEPTKNPEYIMLYVCQEVEGARQASEADADFLGWDSKTIVRALRNAKAEIAEKYEVGSVIPGYNIQINEDNTPGVKSDGSEQDQKQTPEGVKLFDVKSGLPIYRHTSLVKGDADHVLLENQPVSGTNSPASARKVFPGLKETPKAGVKQGK